MPHFGLFLSDMRAPHIEDSDRLAAWSPNREDLERLLEREKVEPYTDGQWHKVFRSGGPLEWFNHARYTPANGAMLGDFFVQIGSDTRPFIEEIMTPEEAGLRAKHRHEMALLDVFRADIIDVTTNPAALPRGE